MQITAKLVQQSPYYQKALSTKDHLYSSLPTRRPFPPKTICIVVPLLKGPSHQRTSVHQSPYQKALPTKDHLYSSPPTRRPFPPKTICTVVPPTRRPFPPKTICTVVSYTTRRPFPPKTICTLVPYQKALPTKDHLYSSPRIRRPFPPKTIPLCRCTEIVKYYQTAPQTRPPLLQDHTVLQN